MAEYGGLVLIYGEIVSKVVVTQSHEVHSVGMFGTFARASMEFCLQDSMVD